MNPEKFHVTTPIYYPSDKPHIGHTCYTVATDAMAHYKCLQGYEVIFLIGTDEHGQKIEDKTKEAGVSLKEFVDHIVRGPRGVLGLWKLMNISNNRSIRAIDNYHVKSVQKIFRQLYEQGDIYKGRYVGKYCKPCESSRTETQFKDSKRPGCGRDVVDAEEEAYFFRLSKYIDHIQYLLEDTDFLEPHSQVNKMVNNFIKPGLEDLCVSRTSFSWGVPVDFDPGHIVYVWIDTLSNYISALGYGNDRHHGFEEFWPADVHFVGKEIARFHSITWPAIFMILGLFLPKKVYGHDWLLLDGDKVSRSRDNVMDLHLLAECYGADALRYFLLREPPFDTDGNFSDEALIGRTNTDLANGLDNLVNRTAAVMSKCFGERLPEDCGITGDGAELANMLAQAQGKVNFLMDSSESGPRKYDVKPIALAAGLRGRYEAQMEHYTFQDALVKVFKLVGRANKYIDENKPRALAKDEVQKLRLVHVSYSLLECVRLSVILFTPFMPETYGKISIRLGVDKGARIWESAGAWGLLPANTVMGKEEDLFPRIDVEKELAILDGLQVEARRAILPAVEVEPFAQENVDPNTFCKSDFRAAKVKVCGSVEKNAKPLRLILNDGSGTDRRILSGITMHYKPGELTGETLVIIINFPPRKMMGQEDHGMLLSVVHTEHEEEKLHLIMVDNATPTGAKPC